MASGPDGDAGLIARVDEVCERALNQLEPGEIRNCVEEVREELHKPLRVAIAGRVSVGKSTLVNALLGAAVAPTAAGECTRLVTWFSYDPTKRLEVVMRDGSRLQMPLRGTRLPDHLGVDHKAVERLEVFLPIDRLRRMTLIDTPGLSSLSGDNSERTESVIMHEASERAAQMAEALVFVLRDGVRQDDVVTLDSFRHLFARCGPSPATAIAVITGADLVGGGGPEAPARAAELAHELQSTLRSLVSAVIPVIGKLGESSDVLSESDSLALVTLAEMDNETRAAMLRSHEQFMGRATAISDRDRSRLLGLLDLYGISQALEVIDQGHVAAGKIRARMLQLSQIDLVLHGLDTVFSQRAMVLKANAALNELDRIGWRGYPDSVGCEALREETERLRLSAEMREIDEVWAVQNSALPEAKLPDDLREQILDLARGHGLVGQKAVAEDEQKGRDEARARAARWREFANGGQASPLETRIARILYRSHERIATRD